MNSREQELCRVTEYAAVTTAQDLHGTILAIARETEDPKRVVSKALDSLARQALARIKQSSLHAGRRIQYDGTYLYVIKRIENTDLSMRLGNGWPMWLVESKTGQKYMSEDQILLNSCISKREHKAWVRRNQYALRLAWKSIRKTPD